MGYSEQANTGTGWAGGFDLNVTKRLTKKIHGQIGYSYMESKRDDHDGLGEYDFAFSQPHQFNFLLSYKAKNRWILSTKFRYATGKPTDSYIIHTNVLNDPDKIRYSQEIIAKNDKRVNDFISLDIRADYRFQIRQLHLTAFVDIVDILNRFNESSLNISPYNGKVQSDGLAIFPSFGLKFEY
jgi:outer membrane receptor protein involved in Fe transport